MAGGEGGELLDHELLLVQNRIEQCLQHYMSKEDVINNLSVRDNIEPRFTELVWLRLEEENQEFFKAYYLKLLVKDQISEFNRLLSQQVELMRRTGITGIAPVLASNGSHFSQTQQISPSNIPQSSRPLNASDNMHVFNNVGTSIQQPYVHQGGVNGRKIDDVSGSFFMPQNPNMGSLAQTMNGNIMKTENCYSGAATTTATTPTPPFNFGQPGNFLDSRRLIGDATVSSFSSVDSNAQHLNDTFMDGDSSSFGFLPTISQSFPDLVPDFTSTDLLESYCRAPFQATEANNFVNPPPPGDVERMDPASDNLRYQCFGGV